MLSPTVKKQLDRLVAAYEKAIFTAAEFGMQAGAFVSAENIGEVLDYLPQALHGSLKDGIAIDNQRAADEEILHPEDSPFDVVPEISEYYLAVSKLLLEPSEGKRKCILSVVCLPSFQEEWAIQLFETKRSGHTMILTVADKQIWGCRDGLSGAVRRSETRLPPELAQGLQQSWNKMLSRVRHPRTSRLGVDGVQYHFAQYGLELGQKAGKTWSPDDNTAPGKLVKLCHLLYKFGEALEEERRQELLKKTKKVIAWFHELK